MSQKFAWLPVKDADLATLKRELCVAPEYEDKTVAKFQKFCTDNDFDQYGLAAHPNPLTLKSVLAGSDIQELFTTPGEEWFFTLETKEPGFLMDHAPCMFQNSKTGPRCYVTQPYLPMCGNNSRDAKAERQAWMKHLETWAKDVMGVKYKVLDQSSWYFSDTVLVVFYLDGDIVG